MLGLMMCLCVCKDSEALTTKWNKNFPMGNGIGVSYYSKKSNCLWIGDSRMIQMYKYSGKDSVVACWGGHYCSMCDGVKGRIDNAERMNAIKKIVKKTIRKFGSINVILVPTINDYTGPRSAKWTVSNYMYVYKRIKKLSKKVHLITPSLISKYGGTSTYSFNKKIKGKVMHYLPVTFKAKHYLLSAGDRVHFSRTGLKYLKKRVRSVISDAGDSTSKRVSSSVEQKSLKLTRLVQLQYPLYVLTGLHPVVVLDSTSCLPWFRFFFSNFYKFQ